MSQRLAMGVEYDGTRFHGWQRQAQEPTVQGVVEQALSRVADTALRIHGSGRTDAGVHALGQVFHFDAPVARSRRSWLLGGNSHLPADVVLTWCREVDGGFDARRSARARVYRYTVVNRWMRPALDRFATTWIRQPLDAARMHEAGQCLVGEHDFSAFRSVHCQARHAVRRLTELAVVRRGDRVELRLKGNAFLHHMVRNIMGTLLAVGRGEEEVAWVAEVLAGRDRTRAGVTAPPEGLVLDAVLYPSEYGLPAGPDTAEGAGA